MGPCQKNAGNLVVSSKISQNPYDFCTFWGKKLIIFLECLGGGIEKNLNVYFFLVGDIRGPRRPNNILCTVDVPMHLVHICFSAICSNIFPSFQILIALSLHFFSRYYRGAAFLDKVERVCQKGTNDVY